MGESEYGYDIFRLGSFCGGPQHWGEVGMDTHGPELDARAVREHYSSAIATYEEAARSLSVNRPEVAAADFGEGFAAQGADIVEALERLHDSTMGVLASRTHNWERIIEVTGDVERGDETWADEIDGVFER